MQMLDGDARIEAVLDKWLGTLGRHLQVDTAQIFQLNSDGTAMDVLCEWCKQGKVSAYDRIREPEVPEILKTDKPSDAPAACCGVFDRMLRCRNSVK